MVKVRIITSICIACVIICLSNILMAQNKNSTNRILHLREQNIIAIAAMTAKGDLPELKSTLHAGLDAGLTINQIKEVLVHTYAYCGFPRSIRGLQTFMEVLDERKAKGIVDEAGKEASPVIQESDKDASLIREEQSKYERGKKILGELTKTPQKKPSSGYGAFAPVMDTFLKEHLFADIFERDVLTYAQREWATISVISAIGGAEPMLRSHLSICLNVGITPAQLTEFPVLIRSIVGRKEAKAARIILNEVLNIDKSPE